MLLILIPALRAIARAAAAILKLERLSFLLLMLLPSAVLMLPETVLRLLEGASRL